MVVSGLMPFQRAKSSNPLSLFGDKIGRWMDKILPPLLPAPGALPARTTIEVTTPKRLRVGKMKLRTISSPRSWTQCWKSCAECSFFPG